MSKIFITGDTHRTPDRFYELQIKNKAEDLKLTKDDYLIVCGDFGFIWNTTQALIGDDNRWLDEINSYPWTTLFIDGNHENFYRLYSHPLMEWHGGRVHKIRDSVYHLMRGEVYNINNKKFFCFGGARSVDRAYRIAYQSWWPEEIPSKDEYDNAIKNLESINWKPDYIITHAMPDAYIKEFYGSKYTGGDKASYMLNDFLYQCSDYKKWCCGHYHVDAAMRPDFQICYKKIYGVE